MGDLMMASSSSHTLTPTASTGGGGGCVDAQSVTVALTSSSSSSSPQHKKQQCSSSSLLSSTPSSSPAAGAAGGGGNPTPSRGRTIIIPHPQNCNNGQQMSYIGDDSSSHNNNTAHHQNHNGSSSALQQHNRNHSHPLLFSSCNGGDGGVRVANNNHVESSSSSAPMVPEMAMTNNGGANSATGIICTNTAAALPSSLATTMNILNLDFVNGNSSYCHNINNGPTTTSPLSPCWPQQHQSKLEHHHQTPTSASGGGNCNGCGDLHSVSACSTGDSSPSNNNISNTTSAKIPGEIPDSVMKYLLTKTDSVESARSAHSSSGSTPSSSAAISHASPSSSSSSFEHNKRLQEILVDLDTLQSTSEIAKVLENFNAILEKIEQDDDKEALEGLEALTTPLSPSVLQCPTATVSSTSRIKNSVETLADLLLSGCGDEEDDEDLLIIVDENDSESLQAGAPPSLHIIPGLHYERGVLIEDGHNEITTNPEEEDEDDDVSSLVEIDPDYLADLDQEEGYESDRPIVRASMRKLRPVRLLPMPSTSHHHHHRTISESSSKENNNAFSTPPPTPVTPRASSPVDPNVGLATTLNSPIANKIIVTSLMNNLNNSSPHLENSGNSQRTTSAGGSGSSNYAGDALGQSSSSSSSSTVAVASCSSSALNNNSFVPTLEVLHVTSNSSQSRSHSRNQSNSSQVIQFHQNPVTVTTNPAGFVEVSIGNGSSDSQASTSAGSAISSNNGTASACQTTRGSCNTSTPTSTNAAAPGSNVRNANGTSNNQSSENSGTTPNTNSPTSNNTASRPATVTSTTSGNNNTARSRPRAPQAPTQAQQRSTPAGLRAPAGRWPHRLSSVLAVIGCTLGLNNICRFSLLSVQYGANFILQFIFLSIVFGIPLLTFHMSIGQYLSSGIIDMWKISPIFQGIGVGLVISQAMIGIYTTVGVSWIFIYFRDSFITRQDQYRWGKCVREFGGCDPQNVTYYNSSISIHKYNESVPDYFNAVVLQRASSSYPDSAYVPSSLKFTVAFNLAVVWMLVFVSLSKGLKSYGKVVHGFVLAPVTALFVLAFKMVGLVQTGGSLFGQTKWSDFFFSSQTWVAAAREAFFTWGLLGACVMQITAHNRHSHSLKSDSVIVIMVTLIVLMLSAFIGNACYSILTAPNSIASQTQFSYVPSSFESKETYKFLEIPNEDNVGDMYDHHHISFLMGVRVIKQGTDFHQRSGYQVLRLATELFPATMAVLSQTGMSSFWTVLFYFAFVLFGIAQQIAIWHCVIKGIIAVKGKVLRSWETTITFFVCGLGFVLGLPLCTETGIFIEYFMDYAIGSGWWIMVLYLLELIAVFIVRGAPYCGENIVTVLITGRNRLSSILAPLISFIWNVIMPVAILVLSIASFKNGNIRELYDWNPKHGYRFWPSWTREVGSLIQLVPILAVPFVAILQSCRYLSTGPPDLFDRMQQLYRPNSQGLFGNPLSDSFNESSSSNSSSSRNGNSSRGPEDPPPKYTPPPSYSTATGAKIAKFLRNSFRRSLRRLSSPGGPSTSTSSPDNLPPPPNYASVILEINSQRTHQSSSCPQPSSAGVSSLMNPIMVPPPAYDERTMAGPNVNIGAKSVSKLADSTDAMGSKLYQIQLSQTLGRSLAEGSKERASLRRIASDITSRDIARMLRASLRRANRDSPEATTSVSVPSASTYSTNSSPGQGIIVTIPVPAGATGSTNGTPSEYTFGPSSIEKVEYDLEMLNDYSHSTPDSQLYPGPSTSAAAIANSQGRQGGASSSSSSAFGFNFGFNRARNRNSNDSQLALITSGMYDDLTISSNGMMGGTLANGEIEIDQFTQLNLPRRDSLSQLNVRDLGQQRNVNPTFHVHNANVTEGERVERAADSEA